MSIKNYVSDVALYNFVEYYYSTNDNILGSKRRLCKELNISEAKLRKFTKMFFEWNYIYKEYSRFKLSSSKRILEIDINKRVKNTFINIWNDHFIFYFNKYSLLMCEPEIEFSMISNIIDVTYLLFSLVDNNNIKMLQVVEMKDGEMWMKHVGINKHSNTIIFAEAYTQKSKKFVLSK